MNIFDGTISGEGCWGTDESVFQSILVTRSYLHLRRVFVDYEQKVGHDIEKTIEKEFCGDLRKALLTLGIPISSNDYFRWNSTLISICSYILAKCVKSKVGFFAERLYKSMKGLGTDDKTLIRIIVCRSEIDLGDIKVAFEQQYGKSLKSWIEVGFFERFFRFEQIQANR